MTAQEGIEVSAASSSNSFEVPNNVGAVVHQLWYKDCLVKSTNFNACTTSTPVTTSAPVTSSASTMVASLMLLGAAALF